MNKVLVVYFNPKREGTSPDDVLGTFRRWGEADIIVGLKPSGAAHCLKNRGDVDVTEILRAVERKHHIDRIVRDTCAELGMELVTCNE